MEENKPDYSIWIVFAIMGGLFFIIGLFMLANIFNYENKVETKATITEISSYVNANHDISYNVYVSYTVDGKRYESELNVYSSSFYEGKEIDIYYDKDNPYVISSKSFNFVFIMFPGIGLIFLIRGIKGILEERKISYLRK